MPKYYCEYCDIYLTHSSPGGRRQHNAGRKHINNKIDYFMSLIRDPKFQPPQYILEMGGGVGMGGVASMLGRPAILTPSGGAPGGPAIIRPPSMAWAAAAAASNRLMMMMGRGAAAGVPQPPGHLGGPGRPPFPPMPGSAGSFRPPFP